MQPPPALIIVRDVELFRESRIEFCGFFRDLLHHPAAIFPLRNPAIVSMPLSFLFGIVASLLTREPEAEAMFDDEKLRTYLGIGAE